VAARGQSGLRHTGGRGKLRGEEVSVMLNPLWRTSTRSQDTNCVEVAYVDGEVLLRDTKDRESRTLAMTPDEWRAFVEGVKDGEFDL
jgi:hypothetical protein